MSKGKILITGAAGFVGSRVVAMSIEAGYEVRCLLRSTSNLRRLEGLVYERFEGDITDSSSVMKGMEGCTHVIHLASLSNWKDIHSPKMPQVVIEGSRHVIEAAQKHGNLPMVYVSSSTAIDGTDEVVILNEDSPFTLDRNAFVYPYAKKQVEEMCKAASLQGLPVFIVNPTEIYGPMDWDKITLGNLIDFATTKQVQVARGGTSIVHVDDVAMGILAALERGKSGERYILGGDNMEFRDLASLTLEILGIDKKVSMIPRKMLLVLAWVSKTFRINMGFEPAVIPYAVKYWFVDNRKAKRELGISFRSPVEILTPTLEWAKSVGYLDKK
jgi:dihydroflavonol-4-reductase